MSWVYVAVAGGTALAGAGSYLSAKKASKSPGYNFHDPYGTFGVADWMRPLMQQRAQNQSVYGGQYAAPMTDLEGQNVARAGALSGQMSDYGNMIMKGEFPEDYYQSAIYRPMMKQYQEDVQPLIEEQYAGPGGSYWGGARAGAVGKGYRDLGDSLAAQRAALGYKAKYEAPMEYMDKAPGAYESLGRTISLPRQIEQYGLDQQYTEWVRGREEMAQYMDAALSFLNVTGVVAEQKKNAPSAWGHALSTGGSMLSQMGMMGMLSGGGAPAASPSPSVGGTGSLGGAKLNFDSQYFGPIKR
jgi:hypothetical protein